MQNFKAPAIGDIFADRYEIVSLLGQGGFGVVYRGIDQKMEREVAIKMLLPHLMTLPGLKERFKREATLASSLNSPHTIRLYEWGELDSGILYIVMELLKGKELEDILEENGPLHPEHARQLILEVLDSLAEAHQHHIVHRDLKPSNIFLCEMGRRKDFVKVLDFGIAKIVDDDDPKNKKKLTATGQTLGTPYYMAPEQIQQGKLGPYTDLYSLGLILGEMIVGEPLVQGSTPIEIIMAHAMPQPTPLPPPLAKSPLAPILKKAIAKDPKNRYLSAEEMIEDLEALDLNGFEIKGITYNYSFEAGPSSRLSGGYLRTTGQTLVPSGPPKYMFKLIIALSTVFAILIIILFFVFKEKDQIEKEKAQELKVVEDLIETENSLNSSKSATSRDASIDSSDVDPNEVIDSSSKDSNKGYILNVDSDVVDTMDKSNLGTNNESSDTADFKEKKDIQEIAIPPKMVMIKLDTDPEGAEIWKGDQQIGITPLLIEEVSVDKKLHWTIKLKGYEEEHLEVDLNKGLNATLVLKKKKVYKPPTRSKFNGHRKNNKNHSKINPTKDEKSNNKTDYKENSHKNPKKEGSFRVD